MAMRLISATDRPLAALALLSLLSACATTASELSSEPHPAGWRIVERTGEARYSPPDSATWMAAITGQVLAGGSEIATGRGGRLIVDAPGRHLTVGPESRFVLPDGERDPWLDQRAGWLRYRIAEAGKQSFRIQTRSLEVELSSGVVDVHVDHGATEVTVKEGQVRVATPDGLRQSQMIAGQSAHAGSEGETALALRRAPGEALQPVEPMVVPALQPKPAPAEAAPGTARAAAPTRGAISETAEALDLRSTRLRPVVASTVGPLPADAGARQPGELSGASATGFARQPEAVGRPGQAVAFAPLPSGPEAIRRGKFERLTAGVLAGIRPPHPAPASRPSR